MLEGSGLRSRVFGCSRGERCDADGSRMGELCEMCVGSKTDTACYR